VWEVHLAGGFELDGFWLDAHSGAIPEPLERICRDMIPSLPNLKAIVFELFSSFLPHFGLDSVRRELEKVHELWALRGTSPYLLSAARRPRTPVPESSVGPAEWEQAFGRVVVGRAPSGALEEELAVDPGARLVQVLIKEFRASMVVAVYRLSCRLLMLALGPDVFRALLEDFWSRTPPHQFAGTEADGSCSSRVLVNTRGLPGDRQKDKKFYMRRSSWPPRGPLLPGDALDAGRADARCLLRLPPRAASHPSACSYPRWLGPWRHPIQQDLAQGPDMIGQPGRHRWRIGAPLLGGARAVGG
jgi:hypothetical protein